MSPCFHIAMLMSTFILLSDKVEQRPVAFKLEYKERIKPNGPNYKTLKTDTFS